MWSEHRRQICTGLTVSVWLDVICQSCGAMYLLRTIAFPLEMSKKEGD